MTRRLLLALCLTLAPFAACDSDAGGAGSRRFEPISGLEGKLVLDLAVAGDGTLYASVGITSTDMLLRWDGTTLETVAVPQPGAYRLAVDPAGIAHVASPHAVYRIEADGVVQVGKTLTGDQGYIGWMAWDDRGGLFVGGGNGPFYLAPGKTDWADLGPGFPLSPTEPARAATGHNYFYSYGSQEAGIWRLPPGGGPPERVFDCSRAEFSFCSSGADFAGNGQHPVHFAVAHYAQPGGGKIYRLDGDTLTKVADGPEGEGYFRGFAMSPEGRVYLAASLDNGDSETTLYRLNGSEWEAYAVLPGTGGALAIGRNERIFSGQDVVFNPGGLWRLVK